jgi:uridine kinase
VEAQPIPAAEEFVSFLQRLPRRHRTLLVGIDGPGGAGKSTFARKIGAADPGATIVEFDDFYRLGVERASRGSSDDREIGGNFDWRRLREQVLRPLSRDREGRYQRYDWPTDALAEWHTVPVGGTVVIEGNYCTRRDLFAFYDYTVWIDAPKAVRLERGVHRGGEDTRDRWLEEWMPEEERYMRTENPSARVHLVLDGRS